MNFKIDCLPQEIWQEVSLVIDHTPLAFPPRREDKEKKREEKSEIKKIATLK